MKCPNCNTEIQVRQGKKVPFAYCSCGTRVYLPAGIKLDNPSAKPNNESSVEHHFSPKINPETLTEEDLKKWAQTP